MSEILIGNGMFIWLIERCEGGNSERITQAVKSAGLSHVLIKVSNGIAINNGGVPVLKPLVEMLQGAGVEVWGWPYVYGNAPAEEAQLAARRILDLGMDGLVVNAETEYKGRATQAATFMTTVRRMLPDMRIGLSSYRYPQYHRTFPFKQFLEKCDFAMPQVYWMQATNAGSQLISTLNAYDTLYKEIGFRRPVFPTGAAFSEHGWSAKPAEIKEFIQVRQELGLPGQNWWEYYEARHQQPALWEAATGYVPPPPDPGERRRVTPAVPVLNVRSGPGLNYPVVRQVTPGYTMDVFNVNGDWLQVYVPKPMWVYGPLTRQIGLIK